MNSKNKKAIGTITFHSSYNHGSVLQAYALQEYITKKYGDYFRYDIINLRTKRQKDYYNKPFGFYDIKSIVKKIIYRKFKKQLADARYNYEQFINKYLNITKEYADKKELESAGLKYDYYISGSDQIWNYPILDFDWSYFLEFCKNGKKISYAASMGPNKIDKEEITADRIKADLKEYSNISVREKSSLEMIENLTKRSDIEVNIDPTLLLDKTDWDRIAKNRLIKDEYILLYDLKNNKKAYYIAEYLSKKYSLPIVVVKNEYLIDKGFENIIRRYDAGPLEFLSYVKYAKIVVSSSFHGNVFSIIFKKPFLAVGGKNDNRIRDLLKMAGLESRSVNTIEEVDKIDIFSINFSESLRGINEERKKSDKYLRRALDIEKVI